jgi:hypothetical protein
MLASQIAIARSWIGRAFGKPSSSIYFLVAPYGGIRPAPRHRSRLALTLAEREVISRGVTARQSARSIAKSLGRSPSTVSREMSRNGGYPRCRRIAKRPAPNPLKCPLRIIFRDIIEMIGHGFADIKAGIGFQIVQDQAYWLGIDHQGLAECPGFFDSPAVSLRAVSPPLAAGV